MNKTPIYVIVTLTVLLTIGYLAVQTRTTVDTPTTETGTTSPIETMTLKL